MYMHILRETERKRERGHLQRESHNLYMFISLTPQIYYIQYLYIYRDINISM